MRLFEKTCLLLLFFLSILLISSCYDQPADLNSEKVKDEKKKEKRVFVILDNSKSVERESLSFIGGCVRSLVDATSKKHEDFYFFLFTTDVTDRSVQTPLAQIAFSSELYNSYKTKSLKPSERRVMEDSLKKLPDELFSKFMTSIERAMKNGSDKTCIISAMKSVYKYIESSADYDNYLLVISDMLECCKYGCPDSASGFEKLSSKIEKYQLSKYSLSTYIPLDHVAIASVAGFSNKKDGELSESSAFATFWEKVFLEMGYSSMPVSGTSVERWLSNNFQ